MGSISDRRSGGGPSGESSGSVGPNNKMSNSRFSFSLKPPNIGTKERIRLSHEIATEFPLKKPGDKFGYENRNHFYIVRVHEFGIYSFEAKVALTEKNKPYIYILRKELSKNE